MHGKGKLSGIMHKGFKPEKCKTALRMAVARIKLLRNRKEAQVRQMRRELSQLLESGQDQTARIRVEHVIREEKLMAAYDLIGVYCELIVARLSIIESQKDCPIDLKEAIASIIFASLRCADVTELMDVRKHFSVKYGKEFAAAAIEVRPDSGVNRLIIEKLSAGPPDIQTKIKTLSSIAEEHNVKWEPKAFEEKMQKPNDDLLYGSAAYSGAKMPTMGLSASSMSTAQPTYSDASTTTLESSTSHMPPAPANYSSAEVSGNRAAYNPANSHTFSHENTRGPGVSMPPSSQYGATTYSSAETLGNRAAYNPTNSNAFSHEDKRGPGVSIPPSSQYSATIPDAMSREDEVNHPKERKPSISVSNWNMDFKDATSAAQAAADSAEMASIAARAAAQLASRGNFSGEQTTRTNESSTYIHEDTSRKQPVEHLVKDERKSFNKQGPGVNDPRVVSSNARTDVETTETNRAGGQNMSTAQSPTQSHSYGPTSYTGVYDMPTARSPSPSPSHSSESPPLYDDLDVREDDIRTTKVHSFNLPEERFSDAALGGSNRKDVERKQASFDQENSKNYYSYFVPSHETVTHDSSTIWDDRKDTTVGDSPVVFDQYDFDVEEHSTFGRHRKENLFDSFSSQHTEEPPSFQEHNRFASSADWSQRNRSESLVNDRTSTLFSRPESQPSENLEASRKDSPSPHDNVPPAFDSDGLSSDEDEITTTVHVEPARSHSSLQKRSSIVGSSRGPGFADENKVVEGAHRISTSVLRDSDENIEEYESRSTEKYWNTSAFSARYKQQSARTGESPRNSDISGAKGNLGRMQKEDSDLSEEEAEPYKLKGASLEVTEAKEKQSLPFSMRTSAISDDNYEGELGLKFGRLTPGLRNKLRQTPPYVKSSEVNVLPKQTLDETPASTEGSVRSYENDTSPEQTGNIPTSSRTTKSSFGAKSNEEPYDEKQGVGERREARPRLTRNYFDSDDTEKLPEQGSIPTSSRTTKTSFGANFDQGLSDEEQGVGARGEARSGMTRNYFDSDDSENLPEQPRNIPTNSRTTKSSFGANSFQELYDEKPGIGARSEARSRMTRNYFNSDDSEEELGRQRTIQAKGPREQIQSRRTREVTSQTKRGGGLFRTGVQHPDETESIAQEIGPPSEAFSTRVTNTATEERTESPRYSRLPVQRPAKPIQTESSVTRGKSQEADLSKRSASENVGNPNTQTSAETPRESTPRGAASHVHPKLPDYDSFAAHFQALRGNRR